MLGLHLLNGNRSTYLLSLVGRHTHPALRNHGMGRFWAFLTAGGAGEVGSKNGHSTRWPPLY